jgi:hypothetical protein
MHLYVLTTDGGDREDGNVYYCSYLLTDKPALVQLCALMKARIDKRGNILVPRWFDDEEDDDNHPFDHPQYIIEQLADMGIKAELPKTHFVVRKGE